jgi:hypothetical protein
MSTRPQLRALPLFAVASLLLLSACATTGSVDDLERRVHTLEQQLAAQGDRLDGTQATAEQALRRAEGAEASARAAATSADAAAARADEAARKADAIFRKGVSK